MNGNQTRNGWPVTAKMFKLVKRYGITTMQAQIAELLLRDLSDVSICKSLGMTVDSVRWTKSNIYRAMGIKGKGCKKRAELIRIVREDFKREP